MAQDKEVSLGCSDPNYCIEVCNYDLCGIGIDRPSHPHPELNEEPAKLLRVD